MSLDAKRILRNVTSTAGLRIASAGLSFVIFVLLARLWGQGTLGGFATVLAYHTILLQAPLLGLHIPIVRDLAQQPERFDSVLSNALVIATVTAILLCLGLGTVGMMAYPRELHTAFWLAGVSLLPSAITGVAETRLLASERFAVVASTNAGETVLRGIGWGIVAVQGGGIAEAAWVLLAARCGAALVYLASGEFRQSVRFGAWDISVLRSLLALVPTFLGIHVVTALLNRLDFVALSKFATLTDVGIYSAPYRIYEAAMMLPNIIVVVLYPVLARMFGATDGRFEALARQLCRGCLLLGLPCSMILAALAEPMLVTFYGAGFAPGSRVLAILAFVPPVIAVDYAFGISLHASHKQSRDLRVWLGALTVYAISLIVLVPAFGYNGAAVATALTAATQVTARYITVRREAQFASMMSLLARPVAAALVMGGVIATLINTSVALALAAGVAAYCVVLIAVRALTRDDIRLVRGMLAPAPAAGSS